MESLPAINHYYRNPNPLPLVTYRSTVLITEQEFVERSAQQWRHLREYLDEQKLRFLRGRLASSALVSPVPEPISRTADL